MATNTQENLANKIRQDLNSSLKAGKETEVLVLRQLLAVFLNKEKEKRYLLSKANPDSSQEKLDQDSLLNGEEMLGTVSNEVKKRNEAIELYEKGGRPELAAKEKKEIEVLLKYLPEQISEPELRKIIEEAVKSVGATSVKDMGKVMAQLMPKIKGRADNGLISRITKEFLA